MKLCKLLGVKKGIYIKKAVGDESNVAVVIKRVAPKVEEYQKLVGIVDMSLFSREKPVQHYKRKC